MYVINIAGDLTQLPNREPAQIVLGTILPPLSTNITNLWMVISVLTIILGVLLLLIKKGGITINQNLLPRKSI